MQKPTDSTTNTTPFSAEWISVKDTDRLPEPITQDVYYSRYYTFRILKIAVTERQLVFLVQGTVEGIDPLFTVTEFFYAI